MRSEKHKKRKKTWLVIVPIIILLLIGGNFINNIKAGENGDNENNTLGFLNPFGNKNERINILVFGVDAVDKASVKSTRSDSIMLLSMNSAGKDPVMISIPRDTRVEIPGRKSKDKINHAHAYGEADLLVKTVEKLLDIKVHHYVRINYKAVAEVVDALGGVEVDVPVHMKYTDSHDSPPLHINIPKGLQVLDGRNAVHFMRFRKGYANQDLGRIQAQQQFVNALKDKAFSPSSITKIPQLIEIFYNNVHTNIPKTKMLSMGTKAAGLRNEEINKITLPGKPDSIGGVSYYVVDEAEVKNIINTFLADEKEITYKVEVLNGCGVTGIASIVKEQLEESNIPVSEIGNYTSLNVAVSFIEYNEKSEKKAKEIGKLLKIKQLIKIGEEDPLNDIRVIVGSDLAK